MPFDLSNASGRVDNRWRKSVRFDSELEEHPETQPDTAALNAFNITLPKSRLRNLLSLSSLNGRLINRRFFLTFSAGVRRIF